MNLENLLDARRAQDAQKAAEQAATNRAWVEEAERAERLYNEVLGDNQIREAIDSVALYAHHRLQERDARLTLVSEGPREATYGVQAHIEYAIQGPGLGGRMRIVAVVENNQYVLGISVHAQQATSTANVIVELGEKPGVENRWHDPLRAAVNTVLFSD
ncbi:MAG: hypothetical protein IPJ76_14115 [Flavobacteriales bacterium]|nr:MAG: hypothetical protein IPJ76_14115 [Flavobacteriales bacterium]